MSNGLGQKVHDLTLTLGQGHIKHCPIHHVTYVPAKVTTSKGLGDALQENMLFDL